jgi:hypothetical protein
MGGRFFLIGGPVDGRGQAQELFPHPAQLPLQPLDGQFLAADSLIQIIDYLFLMHEAQFQLRNPFFHINTHFLLCSCRLKTSETLSTTTKAKLN